VATLRTGPPAARHRPRRVHGDLRRRPVEGAAARHPVVAQGFPARGVAAVGDSAGVRCPCSP